jgi:hypothetical protein
MTKVAERIRDIGSESETWGRLICTVDSYLLLTTLGMPRVVMKPDR